MICQYYKKLFMKGNINMEKQKRITLNADKRKVIADVFQNHFEDNSKFKKSWQQAKDTYTSLRKEAKIRMEVLIRKHQPQEDVDTIRSMINKYGENNGGQLHHDNCFYVQTDTPKIEEDYHGDKKEVYDFVGQVMPERFFDILYQNTEMFDKEDINTEFLPNIDLQYCGVFL